MKKWTAIALTAVLAAALAVPVFAEDTVSTWAQDAVNFAVENGMMSPEAERPRDSATRAELAHMMAALFNVETEADLRTYTDVPADMWFAPDMAKAVSIGLYGGGNTLSPKKALTREEAFQFLARCFGVADGKLSTLAQFSDTQELNEWAALPIAGMVEAGCIQGGNDKLKPQETIARQDLAILIYRLANCVLREEGEVPEKGNLVVPAGVSVPKGSRINGDLILCAGSEPLTLEDVEVTGRIVIHGGSVVLAGETSAAGIVCRGQGIALSGKTLPAIHVTAGELRVESGECEAITVDAAAVRLDDEAHAASVLLRDAESRISGMGKADEVLVQSDSAKCLLSDVKPRRTGGAPVESVKIVATKPANETTPSAPNTSTTVTFENVGSAAGGPYILAWYMDGKLMERVWNYQLKEGATASFSATAAYTGGKLSENVNIMVRLSDGVNAASLSQSVSRHVEQMGPPVDTMRIEATVAWNVGLFADSGLGRWIANVPRGTVVTFSDYRSHLNTYVTLPDGRQGYVMPSCLQISTKDFVQKEDYTTYQKERYVNQENSYESSTGMLVWLSRRTQRVNVFQGSKGNWKLTKSFLCCSGKNATPTVGGVFKYYSRTGRWDFGSYYVDKPMLFNGGHAFHTRTYIYGSGGALLDASIGVPRSHGCVRMYDADVNWLWNNMKMGTTVVVY